MKVQEVKERLQELKIRPLKSLGQNFLIDDAVINQILQAFALEEFDKIIEIGPGLGSLTENLMDFREKLTLIELDKTLSSYWKDRGLNLCHQDALQYNWRNLPPNTILISNLPYQISSRILVELFISSTLEGMVLMFQKEVGERILASCEDKKQYGLISILCHLAWGVSKVTSVGKGSFYPQPDVESIVLKFEKKNVKIKNRKDFVHFLKILFSSRRKKINTTLKKKYDLTKVENKYLDMRPDQISPQEHLNIFEELYV